MLSFQLNRRIRFIAIDQKKDFVVGKISENRFTLTLPLQRENRQLSQVQVKHISLA